MNLRLRVADICAENKTEKILCVGLKVLSPIHT